MPESRGKREWELLGTGFHFDEKFLEVDSSGSCTSMWIYLMLQDCMLKNGSCWYMAKPIQYCKVKKWIKKNGWHGKFYVVYFTTLKKEKAGINC